mgnify:CR=1 FL=1
MSSLWRLWRGAPLMVNLERVAAERGAEVRDLSEVLAEAYC